MKLPKPSIQEPRCSSTTEGQSAKKTSEPGFATYWHGEEIQGNIKRDDRDPSALIIVREAVEVLKQRACRSSDHPWMQTRSHDTYNMGENLIVPDWMAA